MLSIQTGVTGSGPVIPLPLELPDEAFPGKQLVMAQVLGFLWPTWKSQAEF